MNEMVERVARAICRAHRYPSGGNEDAVSDEWERFLPEARAAIVAMREPTEAMMRAGADAPVRDPTSLTTWYAMIDEALRDE